MTNFMSYTVPACMSVFSPLQVNLMRYTLNNSQASVVNKAEDRPNVQLMTYDNQKIVYTLNSIASGWHTIYTNLNTDQLTSNVTWSANTPYLYPTGTKNTSANFVVNSGQSVTLSISASNLCSTASRNPAFITYSGYSFYSSTTSKSAVGVKFDFTKHLELLPYHLRIYDENGSVLEMEIDFTEDQLTKKLAANTFEINTESLNPGIKILKFYYRNLNPAEAADHIKTSRITVN